MSTEYNPGTQHPGTPTPHDPLPRSRAWNLDSARPPYPTPPTPWSPRNLRPPAFRFNFGITLAYTSPSLLPMEVSDESGVFTSDMSAEESDGTVTISTENGALFSSILNIGAMLGSVLGGIINNKIGRKWTLLTVSGAAGGFRRGVFAPECRGISRDDGPTAPPHHSATPPLCYPTTPPPHHPTTP